MSVSRLLGACAAIALLGVALPAEGKVLGRYHVFPAPSDLGKAVPASTAALPMNYYGGPVFSGVKVVSVIWGDSVPQNTKDQVPLFTAALVDSTFVDQLKQYSTLRKKAINGHRSTKQTIGRGTYLGQVQITPHNTAALLTDAAVQNELKQQIAAGVLPPHDLNTLYMIYFPSSVFIDLDGSFSCLSFGAYHFATNDKKPAKGNIFYTVEPECGAGFGYLTFAASHEFSEAITDNIPTPGTNPDFPQAWNDAQGNEIADKCPTSGTLTATSGSWEVTQVFLNSTGACSTGDYTSP